MRQATTIVALCCCTALAGCATIPSGPTARVFPGSDKTFEEFQADDATCRAWAGQRIGLTPEEISKQSTFTGTGIGAVLGAGLGALLGSASGNAGIGAAIGAGTGALIGTSAGADHGRVYGYEAQQQYNTYYLQCMYLKGNQVPGVEAPRRGQRYTPPPPPNMPPPPPALSVPRSEE